MTVSALTDAKIRSEILSDKLPTIPESVGLVAEMIADAHLNGLRIQHVGAVSSAGGFIHETILRYTLIQVKGSADIFG